MLPILNLGPLAIQTPGLILLIGVWIGLTQAEKYARFLKIDSDHIYSLSLLTMVAGIFGARLSFAAQNPAAFQNNWTGLFSLTLQMMDTFGGGVIGLLAAFIYGQRKGLPFWKTLDVFTPGFAVLAIAFGFAQLSSGDAFGAPANLPWSIHLWGEWRHPSQIYFILSAGLIALLVWPRSGSQFNPSGVRFLVWIGSSALARIFLETFRGDSPILIESLRSSQITAWLILAGALVLLNRRLTHNNILPEAQTPQSNPE